MKKLSLAVLLVLSVQPFSGRVLSQTQTGSISGRISSPGGEPLAGLPIIVTQRGLVAPGAMPLTGETVTDATGSYKVENVPPGDYYVIAGQELRAYYPGVRSATEAKAIKVKAGSAIAGIDFVASEPPSQFLRRLGDASTPATSDRPVKVSGRVIKPVESGGAVILLPMPRPDLRELVTQPDRPRALPILLMTTVEGDGSFVFPSVPPGSYRLYYGGRWIFEVSVGSRDLTGIEVVASQP